MPSYSLLSSLLRDVFLNIQDKTPWMRDQFIARPLQSVQTVSCFGLLYSRGVLNPHKDKWQHDSLDGGSHHHKASNSTRQHINLSTNTHLPRGIPNRVHSVQETQDSARLTPQCHRDRPRA